METQSSENSGIDSETMSVMPDGAMYLPVLRMNLSFAGCGLLAIYHLGVAKMLITHGSRFMMNVQRFGGASAGALTASILAIRGCCVQTVEVSTLLLSCCVWFVFIYGRFRDVLVSKWKVVSINKEYS